MAASWEDKEQMLQILQEYGFDAGDMEDWPSEASAYFPSVLPLPSPEDIDKIKPKLVFYTKEKKQLGKTFELGQVNDFVDFFANYADEALKVIIVAHGFKNCAETEWLLETKNVLLNEDEKKVVVIVGWSGGSDLYAINYRYAAANIQVVGKWLGTAVKSLKERHPKFKFHGIGHSLGAHLMGQAGRSSDGAFYRITGLDPAGPRFDKDGDEDRRLRPTDATEMVDVIHTSGYTSDSWFFKTIHFGILLPLGKLDFFPSYGMSPQPGTENEGTSTAMMTNHSRAYEYFIWSVQNPGKFQTRVVLDGTPGIDEPVTTTKMTSDVAEMGYYAYKQGGAAAAGNYYLKPKTGSPWM